MEPGPAGAARSFGASVRERRLAAGLSLGELAAQLHYSKGYLSRIENGAKRPGPDLARRCDTFFRADGALLQLVTSPPDAPRETLDDDWFLGVAMDAVGEVHLLRRRELLMGAGAAVFGATATSGSLRSSAGDEATVDGYAGMLDQLRAQGRCQPASLVLPAVMVHLSALSALAGAATGAARTRILAVGARYAEYAGWLYQECGDDRGMAWSTDRAVRFAEAAGDHELAIFADVRHANVAMYRDDAATTVELAARAIDRAATLPDGGPRLRSLALQRLAQGRALQGQRAACLASLEEAAELAATLAASGERGRGATTSTAGGRDRPCAGDGGLGMASVSDPLTLVRGWCLVDLGEFDAAVALLRRHRDSLPPTAMRARARVEARLAVAHASAGDRDEACRSARAGLGGAVRVDSATVRQDIRHLARLIGRWRSDPQVQDLAVELTHALRTPVTALRAGPRLLP